MSDLYCDICGRSPVRAQILVEGAKMLACGSCMRSGKVLHRFDPDSPEAPQLPPPSAMETSEEIVEDYGRLIRSRREKLGLPLSVVAERLKEREPFLNAIENGRLAPTLEVARKLEKELGIKLVEKVQSSLTPSSSPSKSFTPPTLGDMIETKKKKK
ncbi:MAG TPA: multiprotein-bridging factor 1 family protein [Candidatus Bilamarchaeum sp.]|nr:multiprotein-bridging factor 1 family protein [Candidatus Bilamarchaeum sp.]